MERSTWVCARAIVLTVMALLLLPLQAQAERNWEFSVGAFGGKAFNSNEDVKFNFGQGSGFTTGTAYGVNLNDSPTFGAKVTAWYLPRQYKWQPQIGLELDYTKFTADLNPQTAGASGTSLTPGFELGSVAFTTPQDISVNVLAANLLFRYPIWATPELPQGRFYPISEQILVCSALTSRSPWFHIKKRVTPRPSKVWSASSFSFFETLRFSGNGRELRAGTRLLTTVPGFHWDSARGTLSLQTT